MPPEETERFLYQEFIRHKHAERIRICITGQATHHLGVAHAAMVEVNNLLSPLRAQFRRDLALVCESHHLDDLTDFHKYKVSQPYGNSLSETANLQYAAILLRSSDLLHVTSDRTPSIAFRVINPTDPISQQEWAKQMAVTSVRPQIGRDREGNLDESVSQNTIEVHAYFAQAEGFFGLTSYLAYAASQIRKCNEWAAVANRTQSAKHLFPWRYIDEDNIEAEGFIPNTFEFTIDQAKILDLLTGHTLYNDTSVVLRELVQNSLDAVRLQDFLHTRNNSPSDAGRISITWDSKMRVLCVQDNGTGMTQEIIENHLLKVGASRYQDPQFQKDHPGFSSISRFGIGVLSAFMIADAVEIITCHPEDDTNSLRQTSIKGSILKPDGCDQLQDSVLIKSGDKGSKLLLHLAQGSRKQARQLLFDRLPDALNRIEFGRVGR